jgi:hypothetical protein
MTDPPAPTHSVGSAAEPAPRVSVCVISYNHAAFIEQALRSVVEQEAPFTFEVVFADDCSPDGTRAIAERVASETSIPFRFLSRPRRLGAGDNFLDLLAAARGTYVAYLEGDDYWVGRARLANQVALLDSNPHLSGCCGRACVVDDTGILRGDYFTYHNQQVPPPEVDQLAAVVGRSSGPACTLVFRRNAILPLPAWYLRDASHQGLSVVLTERGPLAFMDQVFGHYRVHPGGTWSMQTQERKCAADFRYAAALLNDPGLASRYPRQLGRRLALSALSLGKERLREGKGVQSLRPFGQELRSVMTGDALRALALALPSLAHLATRKLTRRTPSATR